jgi:hypothetical protein
MNSFGLPIETPSDNPIPPIVLGYVSIRGAESVFGGAKSLNPSAKAYHASKADRDATRSDLQKGGFSLIAESALGFSVSGPPGAFETLTGGTLTAKERLVRVEGGKRLYRTHLDITGEGQPTTLGVGSVKSSSSKIDGIVLEKPRILQAMFPSPIPPMVEKFHLAVPDQVPMLLNATGAHRQGQQGDGVTVAMPDSGFYRHPFFTARQYAINTPLTVVPGTDRSKDPVGHGTGESANIFAVAPHCTLQPIRASNDASPAQLVGAMRGFLTAKQLRPQVRFRVPIYSAGIAELQWPELAAYHRRNPP